MNRELDRAIGAGAHDDALVFDGRCDWGEWQTGHGFEHFASLRTKNDGLNGLSCTWREQPLR